MARAAAGRAVVGEDSGVSCSARGASVMRQALPQQWKSARGMAGGHLDGNVQHASTPSPRVGGRWLVWALWRRAACDRCQSLSTSNVSNSEGNGWGIERHHRPCSASCHIQLIMTGTRPGKRSEHPILRSRKAQSIAKILRASPSQCSSSPSAPAQAPLRLNVLCKSYILSLGKSISRRRSQLCAL